MKHLLSVHEVRGPPEAHEASEGQRIGSLRVSLMRGHRPLRSKIVTRTCCHLFVLKFIFKRHVNNN